MNLKRLREETEEGRDWSDLTTEESRIIATQILDHGWLSWDNVISQYEKYGDPVPRLYKLYRRKPNLPEALDAFYDKVYKQLWDDYSIWGSGNTIHVEETR